MNDKKRAFMIIKSMATNYPILNEWEMNLVKLPLVVVEVGQMKTAIRLLSNDEPRLINEYSRKSYIEKKLHELNSEGVICPYTHTKKGADLIRILAINFQLGEFSGKKINAMPIVISEGMPQGIDLHDLFIINIDGNLKDIVIEDMIEVPPDEQVAVVADKIDQTITEKHSSDEVALLAAACFLYPNLKTLNMETEFERILELSVKLVAQDVENHDSEGLSDVFIDILYKWQEQKNFSDVYELPNLTLDAELNIRNTIFFDNDFLYMNEELFKKIFASLLQIVGSDILKSSLIKEGILCRDLGDMSTYTFKMKYINSSGGHRKKCMLRFSRKKVNIPGELDFITICRIAGGKDNGSGKI